MRVSNFVLLGILFSLVMSCALQKKGVILEKKQLLEEKVRQISVVPQPMKINELDGNFIIDKGTKILYTPADKQVKNVIEYFRKILETATGYKFAVQILDASTVTQNAIVFNLRKEDQELGKEGYSMQVTPELVTISANSPAGLFYGVQTFRQLLPVEIESDKPVAGIEWQVPAVEIYDKPRFQWRGMHLDVCRHFFPKEFVKKYIDILAMHKINTFHWHLTEDQGWRIEIKKYPRLTEIGAWRADRKGIHWNECEPQRPGEPATYGGFYTQEEVKEIVAYARERFITVVPEIEMPGHAVAALASYPQYSCTGGPFTVVTGGYWPIKDIFCAGNDSTFIFLENILDEVMELFPSEFIHIGGDEAYKENWEKCPKCQKRIKDEGLKDVHELQSYFIKRIEKHLNKHGRRLIGWDEILEGGLAPNAAVMSWRGFAGGIAAANAGHEVVMSPTTYCYFDYYQAREGEPLAIGGYLPLEKVYAFDPIPADIDPDKRHFIIGAQANLWTEYIATSEHAEYMLLPRLCALSEVVWTPERERSWNDFLNRMQKHYDRLAMAKYNFRVPTPIGLGGESVIFGKHRIELKNSIRNGEIRYTLDGSEPTKNSRLYTEPIVISDDVVIKARVFMKNGRQSNVATQYIYRVDKKKNGMHYSYYEGDWRKAAEFIESEPIKQGKCYYFNLDEIDHREENFGVIFQGYFKIPANGNYTFYVTSDDGSQLFINGKLVVDNDGPHGATEKSGEIYLKKGFHEFKLVYFEIGGNEALNVLYEGEGIEKQKISPRMIFCKK